MKLIIGLGNPGKEYELTRHNIGFMVIDMICNSLQVKINQTKFNGQYVKTTINGTNVIFLKPLTFMNMSGFCVFSFMNYFKIKIDNVLIIHDEVDLSFGQIQYKEKFSAAGHNGIKSIFNQTGTKDFQRLRIGIGKNPNFKTADWVLAKFSNDELKDINDRKQFFVDSITSWIADCKFENIMSKYNKK